MNRLKDKKILVIGANGGIGGACARLFAMEGAQLVVSGRKSEPGEALEGVDYIRYISADMLKSDDIKKLFEETASVFDKIDGMIYCSGIESSQGFMATDEAHFDKVIAVNLKAAFLCSRYAVDLMDEKKGGNIVLVASQKGLCGSTGSLAYNASKGGMIIMAKSMAIELGPKNIRVNSLCPGATDTEMFRRDMRNQSDPVETRKHVAAANLLNRIGEADEIAWGGVFLMSDESSFMTGADLVIDGGNITGVQNL